MRSNIRYLVAVVLLVVIATIFGAMGTVAPPLAESVSPQQSSSSSSDAVAHFQNPPTFDSGWLNITTQCGQYFNITHNLNTTEVFVDITGKQTLAGGEHKINFGGTDYTPEWSQTYSATQDDQAYSVVQTGDGGYALAGYTYSYGVGTPSYPNFWLVKTDWTGDKQWDQTYGGTNEDSCTSLIQTDDGGYALAGYTYRNSTNQRDFYLVKTDSMGNLMWERTFGGTGDDTAFSSVQTSDGGYAIAGRTSSPGASGFDFWLVKTDSDGVKQWSGMYGGEEYDHACSVVQTTDGEYAIAGYTYSYGIGAPFYPSFWLVKTDSDGNMQWDETYGGTYGAEASSLVQTSDGGYALAGGIYPFGDYDDFWLVKTDSDGTMQWNQTYGAMRFDSCSSLIQTDDGGYALAGYANFLTVDTYGARLVKTDVTGNMQWNKVFGGTRLSALSIFGECVVQTSDGGYAIAGYAGEYYGSDDFWLGKTGVEFGLAQTNSTDKTVTLYRGETDPYWNFARVRVWTIEEPTWQYGDINQDGVVDAKDLYIVGRNYGKTFSLLSLSGIIAIGGIQTYKTRKKTKATDK